MSLIGRVGIFVVMSVKAFRNDVIVFISVSLIGRVRIFVVISVEASELTLLFLSQ